jgi:hypothetical protein
VRLRLDWVVEILDALPWVSWAFVGGITEDGPAHFQRALATLRTHPRCAFLGAKPYEELSSYAAAFDLTAFPLSEHLLNRASSPTRFYSQLPYGQPILATSDCEQLVGLEPLVRLCDSPRAFAQAIAELKDRGFRDGQDSARVEFARGCTWEARSVQLAAALETVAPVTRS